MIMQYIQEHVQEQFSVPNSMFEFNLLWIHFAKQLKSINRKKEADKSEYVPFMD